MIVKVKPYTSQLEGPKVGVVQLTQNKNVDVAGICEC